MQKEVNIRTMYYVFMFCVNLFLLPYIPIFNHNIALKMWGGGVGCVCVCVGGVVKECLYGNGDIDIPAPDQVLSERPGRWGEPRRTCFRKDRAVLINL